MMIMSAEVEPACVSMCAECRLHWRLPSSCCWMLVGPQSCASTDTPRALFPALECRSWRP